MKPPIIYLLSIIFHIQRKEYRSGMSCTRISASPKALAIGSGGSMDLATGRERGAVNLRSKPSFKVIRAAQVSAPQYQSVPAIEAGGHMRSSGSLYEVLGLSRGATVEEIKRAYRKMALQFHPDTIATSSSTQSKKMLTEMFVQIQSAYAVLSKAEHRAQYDRELHIQERRIWNRGAYRGRVVRNWETDQCW